MWYLGSYHLVQDRTLPAAGRKPPSCLLLFTDHSLYSPQVTTLLNLWRILKFRFAWFWTSYKWGQTVYHILCLASLLNSVTDCRLLLHIILAHFHYCLFSIVCLFHNVFTAGYLGGFPVWTSVIKSVSLNVFTHLLMHICTHFCGV